MGELFLSPEQVEQLKKFQADGLIWLVNTAVLHPRGYALAIHLDEYGDPLGLSVFGKGDEPWVFDEEDLRDSGVVERYLVSERKREADWSPKLRAGHES